MQHSEQQGCSSDINIIYYHYIIIITRVASHFARSDIPSITCIVARLTLQWHPNIPLRPMARLHAGHSRERPQELHAEFNFTHIKLAVT